MTSLHSFKSSYGHREHVGYLLHWLKETAMVSDPLFSVGDEKHMSDLMTPSTCWEKYLLLKES